MQKLYEKFCSLMHEQRVIIDHVSAAEADQAKTATTEEPSPYLSPSPWDFWK
jgi:hypothetical protein